MGYARVIPSTAPDQRQAGSPLASKGYPSAVSPTPLAGLTFALTATSQALPVALPLLSVEAGSLRCLITSTRSLNW
jgi:hypothetical protein